ncbi:hypothetical protein [Streptomyces canus]|uniref:hypothetical protein n=1 Tax=Streptomyces canus TaxID=58343 RepID=UPI0036EA2930
MTAVDSLATVERMLRRIWAGWFPAREAPSPTMNYLPPESYGGSRTALQHAGTRLHRLLHHDERHVVHVRGLARPTQLLLVPRICDMLFQEYQSELVARVGEFTGTGALETTVKEDRRERLLGDRVREVSCGSAPLSPELKRFVESCLELPLRDGTGRPRPVSSSSTRPSVTEYRLADVPELGYLSTDRPYSRGELLLRTQTITPAYYTRPEATAAVFGEDGFYRTGDTMAETGPDQLAYLDRRNNVLKRPQSEFVTLSRLERVFVTGSLVRQVYIYGNSERDYLLAVIVPTEEAVRRAANRDELSWVLRESLQQVARQAELESYEIPRDFLVETEPFSVENGLLLEIRKNLPPRLKDRLIYPLRDRPAGLPETQRQVRDRSMPPRSPPSCAGSHLLRHIVTGP